MSEPTLEEIGDYDTLKGEKKSIVWSVVIGGLFLGVIYVVSSSYFSEVDDKIKTEDSIKYIPLK